MEYKNYKDPVLEKKLLEIIPPSTYKQFNKLVIDILLRRAYEFDLTEEEILQDARNLKKNVRTIGFEDRKNTKSKFLGVYHCSHKAIIINKTEILRKIEKDGINPNNPLEIKNEYGTYIYKILLHEVFHGIAAHKRGTALDKGKLYNGINEGFNEAAANRCVSKFTSGDVRRSFQTTDGYSVLTIIPRLLANIAGVSEKELLRCGIRGMESTDAVSNMLGKNLYETIDGKPSKEKTDKVLKNFTNSACYIHNFLYSLKSPSRFIPGTAVAREKSEAIIRTLITNTRIATYDFIGNDKRSPEELDPQELVYRYNSIKKIYDGLLAQMEKKRLISAKSYKNIESNEIFEGAKNDLLTQVAGLALVNDNKNLLSSSCYKKLCDEIKLGKLKDLTILSRYGIYVPENLEEYLKNYDCSRYEEKIIREDFESFYVEYQNIDVRDEAARIFMRNDDNRLSNFGYWMKVKMYGTPSIIKKTVRRLIANTKRTIKNYNNNNKNNNKKLYLPEGKETAKEIKRDNSWKEDQKVSTTNNTKNGPKSADIPATQKKGKGLDKENNEL